VDKRNNTVIEIDVTNKNSVGTEIINNHGEYFLIEGRNSENGFFISYSNMSGMQIREDFVETGCNNSLRSFIYDYEKDELTLFVQAKTISSPFLGNEIEGFDSGSIQYFYTTLKPAVK